MNWGDRMQMVIEIPEWFKEMIDKGEAPLEFPLFLAYGIQQGIVLPKGHGRLIDADRLKEVVHRNTVFDVYDQFVDITPTIIEANRSEK